MNMKQLYIGRSLSLIALIALSGCGTTNYYVVLPEQIIGSQAAIGSDWDMDTQFPAMFKYLGCTSFGNGEHEPVCLEIRKLVQACMDYIQQKEVDPAMEKTCTNMVTVDWASVLQQLQL